MGWEGGLFVVSGPEWALRTATSITTSMRLFSYVSLGCERGFLMAHRQVVTAARCLQAGCVRCVRLDWVWD